MTEPLSVSEFVNSEYNLNNGNAFTQIKLLFSPRAQTSLSQVKHEFVERNGMIIRNEKNSNNHETRMLSNNNDIRFIVALGAESGFSEKEEQTFMKHGFQSISLGHRILRTETATIVALSLVQHLFGDLD